MRTLSKLALALCMGLIFVTAASAQPASAQAWLNSAPATLGTPDGVPPSGETICNGLVGAAHGLCTAFCEAMDCDSAAPQASAKACAKVGDNFMKITGQTPPCDCPCVAQYPGFIEALNGPILACIDSVVPGGEFIILETPSLFFPATLLATGLGGACGSINGGPFPVTAPQGTACINLLKQKAAAAGVVCVAPPV